MSSAIYAIPETKKAQETFYPTPPELAKRMISLVKWSDVESVLEPSAGKGDLARYACWELKARKDYRPSFEKTENYIPHADVDCVEIDPNLQAILRDKGFRVVHDDFMTYHTHKRYDLILMNPPFSDGAAHLIRALDMIKGGGQVVCLLNAETLKNPYNIQRRVLTNRLEQLGASIEYIAGAFGKAERGTDVEIALVYVKIKIAEDGDSMIMDRLRPAHKYTDKAEVGADRALAKADYIDAIVDRFNYEVECGIKLIQEYRVMLPLLQDRIGEDKYSSPLISLSIGRDKYGLSVNEYIRLTREKYWAALFKNPQFMEQLTSNLQNDLHSRVRELSNYEFSAYNIYQLMIEMNNRMIGGIEQTILDLFDDWTVKYHWDEASKNIHYYNGWKTNDSFAVNKKVILPLDGYNRWSCAPDEFRAYNVRSRLEDIEKVFNYLDGGRAPEVSLNDALNMAESTGQTRKVPTKHFFMTFYKKGTCHIEFRDPDLLAKFNIFAGRHKNWLPPSFGRKGYKELDREEKAVVDSFMGKDAYEQVVSRPDYFLQDASQMLALTGS